MVCDGKVHLFGYLFLQVLYLLVFKFNNLAALNAYTMVMMAVVRDVLVARPPVTELPFKGNTAFGQEFHSPVYRCIANLGILTPDPFQKLFQIYMGIGFKEYIYDIITLCGRLKTFFLQIFLEKFFFVGQFHSWLIRDKKTWLAFLAIS